MQAPPPGGTNPATSAPYPTNPPGMMPPPGAYQQHGAYPPSPYGQPGPNPYVQQMGYPPPQHQQYGIHGPPPHAVGPGATTVIVVQKRQGNCPRCRVGNIVPTFSICGIILAVLFFPWGILCCMFMRDYRCSNCNASV